MSAADGAPPFDVRCYVAEAVGTAILVLVGPGAAMVAAATHAFGHAGVALAFGLVVALLVAALGTTSGAHLNPAVTLAFWSARRFPARAVAPYVLAQCAGAVAASLALRWILGPVGRLGAVSGVDTSAADAPAADAPLPARGKPVKRAGTVPASPPSRARRRHGG